MSMTHDKGDAERAVEPAPAPRAGESARPSLALWQLGLRRLRRHRLAVGAFYVLAALYIMMLFAEFLAPYHYDNEVRPHSYSPPTLVRVVRDGRLSRPYVYARSYSFDEFRRRVWVEDRSRPVPIRFFVKGDPYRLLGVFPAARHLFGLDPAEASAPTGGRPAAVPARLYLLGADARGRDLLSRLLYGSRVSLTIGLVGVCLTFVLGMLIGGISGYFGGRTDVVLMRTCEMFMMIPGFYLMLALRSALPPEMSSVEVYLLLVAIMSLIGWAGFARVVRGMVLSIRNREYVLAAQASGASHLTIILRHVLPNTLSYAIVALTLSIPGYILGESALSLLGLGIQDPHASWGNLLKEAMDVAQIKFHPWILLPGLCIFVTVMAYNFLGDGLRDAFDPRGLTRGRG
jgi:peptide/nickel transport system permease protein